MPFNLIFTPEAEANLRDLENDKGRASRLKAVRKALAHLEANPRHQSLNTHKFDSLAGANGEEVLEAYAQNQTPSAYRVFWHYGPGKGTITIIAITPHP